MSSALFFVLSEELFSLLALYFLLILASREYLASLCFLTSLPETMIDQIGLFAKISTLFLSEMKGLWGLSIERSNMLLNGSSSDKSRVSASLTGSVT